MKKSILIIDDEPLHIKTLIRSIKESFRDIEFEFHIGNDGSYVKEFFRENDRVDLAIIDYYMPIMNGYRTAKWIRNTVDSKLPIILISGDAELYSDDCDRNQCPFDDFILKPYSKTELKSSLKKFLE